MMRTDVVQSPLFGTPRYNTSKILGSVLHTCAENRVT